MYLDSAKVMSKGQITIPKEIRERLGLSCGDRVTFLVDDDSIRLVNSAEYAMKLIQKEMKSEKVKVKQSSSKDYMDLVEEVRYSKK